MSGADDLTISTRDSIFPIQVPVQVFHLCGAAKLFSLSFSCCMLVKFLFLRLFQKCVGLGRLVSR